MELKLVFTYRPYIEKYLRKNLFGIPYRGTIFFTVIITLLHVNLCCVHNHLLGKMSYVAIFIICIIFPLSLLNFKFLHVTKCLLQLPLLSSVLFFPPLLSVFVYSDSLSHTKK